MERGENESWSQENFELTYAITRCQRKLLDKIDFEHGTSKRNWGDVKDKSPPFTIVRKLVEFEDYYNSVNRNCYMYDSDNDKRKCSLALFEECRKMYSSVLEGTECMEKSFSKIKRALTHTQSVAKDLKERFYETNTEMNSLLSITEGIDKRLDRFSVLSDIKTYFDKPLELIEKDEGLLNVAEKTRKISEGSNEGITAEKVTKYTGITYTCMSLALEAISSKICKALKEISDTTYKVPSNLNIDTVIILMDELVMNYVKRVGDKHKRLIQFLCSECDGHPKFINYKNTCISTCITGFSKIIKELTFEKMFKEITDNQNIENSMAYLLSLILCIISRENHVIWNLFNTSNENTILTTVIPSIIKYLRKTVINTSNFDSFIKTYLSFKRFTFFPQDRIDSKQSMLEFNSVLNEIKSFENFYKNEINTIAPKLDDIKSILLYKLNVITYEYAGKEIQQYRMRQDDIMMFVVNQSDSRPSLDTKISLLNNEHRRSASNDTVSSLAIHETIFAKYLADDNFALDFSHIRTRTPSNNNVITFGQGLNYPTVQRTVYLMRKIFDCECADVCGNLGEHIINLFLSSLQYPSQVILKSKSYLDAVLFFLSNTLNLYNELCEFMLFKPDKHLNSINNSSFINKKIILPLNTLESNISVLTVTLINAITAKSTSLIDTLSENNSKQNKNMSNLPSINDVTSQVYQECSNFFKKSSSYLKDKVFFKQVADALITKVFSRLCALENFPNSDHCNIEESIDHLRNSLLESLASSENAHYS